MLLVLLSINSTFYFVLKLKNNISVVPHSQVPYSNCLLIAYTSHNLHTHKKVIEKQIQTYLQTTHLISFSIGKHVLIVIILSLIIRNNILHKYQISVLESSRKNVIFG